MANAIDYYATLGLAETASQPEIKQAYRRLAKQYHPDKQTPAAAVEGDHDLIAAINAAYEILGDPQTRGQYDQHRRYLSQAQAMGLATENDTRTRHERTVDVQKHYQQRRKAAQKADVQFQTWMQRVYQPIDRLFGKIFKPLKEEVRALSADPFDDALMANFQTYLENCRSFLETAKQTFKSMPNPAKFAGVAANLYYCINHTEDGIEEMERFTYTYDDSYLHTGQELFRIAAQLRREAKTGVKA